MDSLNLLKYHPAFFAFSMEVRIFAAKRNKYILVMRKIFSLFMLLLIVQAAKAYEVSVTMFQVNDSTWNFNVCT